MTTPPPACPHCGAPTFYTFDSSVHRTYECLSSSAYPALRTGNCISREPLFKELTALKRMVREYLEVQTDLAQANLLDVELKAINAEWKRLNTQLKEAARE